jgi:pimeloyl-ACP methyl ester carboxylesterase
VSAEVSAAGLYIEHHHESAPGPPVVLVHGSPDRSKSFTGVLNELSDLPVTTYDRRGYGRSVAAGELGGGFEVHAADLIAVMGGVPSVVVGQSAGGAIAMLASTRAPELFLSVGAWEPPMVAHDWWVGQRAADAIRPFAEAVDPDQAGEDFGRMIMGTARWEGLRPETRALFRAEGRALRADTRWQLEHVFDPLEVSVPVVIGSGTSAWDEIHRLSHSRLAERIGAEHLVVEGADHQAHLGRPAAWAGLVRRAIELAGRAG